MDNGGIEYFLSLVASSLTGVSVKVSLVKELDKRRLGQCFKRNGKFHIWLLDARSYAGALRVFLHETAHIALQKEEFIDLKNYALSSSSKLNTSSEEDKESEAQANKLAEKWITYGKRNSWRYSGSEDEKTLKALLYGDAQ